MTGICIGSARLPATCAMRLRPIAGNKQTATKVRLVKREINSRTVVRPASNGQQHVRITAGIDFSEQ